MISILTRIDSLDDNSNLRNTSAQPFWSGLWRYYLRLSSTNSKSVYYAKQKWLHDDVHDTNNIFCRFCNSFLKKGSCTVKQNASLSTCLYEGLFIRNITLLTPRASTSETDYFARWKVWLRLIVGQITGNNPSYAHIVETDKIVEYPIEHLCWF